MTPKVPTTNDAPPPTLRPRRSLLGVIVVAYSWAATCNLFVDLLQRRVFSDTPLPGSGPLVFLLSTAVLWLALLLLISLTGRLWLSLGVMSAASVVVGLVNYEKLRLRVEPIYPGDLTFVREPGFLLQMLEPGTLVRLCVLLFAFVGVVVLAARIFGHTLPRVTRADHPREWRWLVGVRLVGTVSCLLLLGSLVHFNRPGDPWRRAYDAAGAVWIADSQQANYLRNGFVGGLLYNLETTAMTTPPGYSATRMRSLEQKYAAVAAQLNATRDPHALDDVNIVVVLSESFSDPTRIHGVHLEADPIKRTRTLMRTVPSGNALAQSYGGGTANMGFETLTGMSMSQFSPQLTYPYSMLLPKYRKWPSAVGLLKSRGYRAVAVHPYKTEVFRRDKAYPVLGFDEFVHDSTMASSKKIEHSPYISDESAFDEVSHQIRVSDKPLYTDLVTMQNHFPWAGSYDHPARVTGVTGESLDQAGNYVRGIGYTDEALAGFLADLEQSPEKTIVLFYGDHLPAIWPEQVQAANPPRSMRQTPFFLWANFKPLGSKGLPTTSPAFFFPLIFDALNAPLPPYYALLHELYGEVPALTADLVVDSKDQLVDTADLSPRTKELLADYRLVVYDLSIGHRYSQAGMFYADPATNGQASGTRD